MFREGKSNKYKHQKTTTQRHSRESGNPVTPMLAMHPHWIPTFVGMTNRGVLKSLLQGLLILGISPPVESCPEGGAIPLPWRGAPKGRGGDSPPVEGCPEGDAIPLPWRGAPKGRGGDSSSFPSSSLGTHLHAKLLLCLPTYTTPFLCISLRSLRSLRFNKILFRTVVTRYKKNVGPK